MFKEFDVLDGRYFIDISNVDSDSNTDVMLHRLFVLGCKPIYDTFREVNLATGITSATWRVYFLSTACPSALIVNGSVCDQVLFDNKLHPAHGKNAPFQSERLPLGYRSHHCIDLATTDDEFPPTTESNSKRKQTPAKSYAQAAKTKPAQTFLQRSIAESKKRDDQLNRGAPHGQRSAATQLVTTTGTHDDALSISTFTDSSNLVSPPGSPKPTTSSHPPPLLLMADGFTTVTNSKKKRGRSGISFSDLLVKQQPRPLNGIATANYFRELQSMEVTFESKDVTADKTLGVRRQVVPVDVKRSETVKTANESAFFMEKHHTKITKASQATLISEVTESMLNDENTALLNILPDRLAEADKKVGLACKLVENATNPDHITKVMTECPLAFNSTMSLKMAGNGSEIAELAQLHAINRVFCATFPKEDTTFARKWRKLMGTKVPSTRRDIFTACAKWWTYSTSIHELSRATKALGLFELALMATAPTLFTHDHWIQYITGQPVEWIPAHNTRLLHPNTLLRLLRSDLGAHCMKQWHEVQWQGYLLDDLESLRTLTTLPY